MYQVEIAKVEISSRRLKNTDAEKLTPMNELEKTEQKNASSIQVLIAALNEEEGIGHTISELNKTLGNPRILVVDSHSTDKTVSLLRSWALKLILATKKIPKNR